MASIFISFAHTDDYAAKAISMFLRDLGEVFGEEAKAFRSSDRRALIAGEDWMARIKAELKTTKVLVSMITRKSTEDHG
jgi:hypothetical protein